MLKSIPAKITLISNIDTTLFNTKKSNNMDKKQSHTNNANEKTITQTIFIKTIIQTILIKTIIQTLRE